MSVGDDTKYRVQQHVKHEARIANMFDMFNLKVFCGTDWELRFQASAGIFSPIVFTSYAAIRPQLLKHTTAVEVWMIQETLVQY